ncbi:hypothetical protein F7725_009473, partial [Dissostichus mawsoni]
MAAVDCVHPANPRNGQFGGQWREVALETSQEDAPPSEDTRVLSVAAHPANIMENSRSILSLLLGSPLLCLSLVPHILFYEITSSSLPFLFSPVIALAGYLHPPPPPPPLWSPTAALGCGVSSGMEEIRTGGLMEGLCPSTSSIWTNHGQDAAVGFPLTPSPDP